jgi:hypothetical protein
VDIELLIVSLYWISLWQFEAAWKRRLKHCSYASTSKPEAFGMSRKRSAEEAPGTEPQAKRGAVPGSSDQPLEAPPFAATPLGSSAAATSSTASGGARRAALPSAAAESSMKESNPPSERMVAGAGARTVAARIMGRGGGGEDSSGSATMTQGGGGPRRGQSDDEGEVESWSEPQLDLLNAPV